MSKSAAALRHATAEPAGHAAARGVPATPGRAGWPRYLGGSRPGEAAALRGASAPIPASVRAVLATPGQALDGGARRHFEARFGHDFGHVRVHADALAAASAAAIGANAYAAGGHLVFAEGRYRPASADGQRLLAHELGHVVQQGARAPGEFRGLTSPGDSFERDAQAAAHSPGRRPGQAEGSLAQIACDDDSDKADLREFVKRVREGVSLSLDQDLAALMAVIAEPQVHKDEAIALIDKLGTTHLDRAVALMGTNTMEAIAGSDAGSAVLRHLQGRVSKIEQVKVGDALAARAVAAAAPAASPTAQDVINAADLLRLNLALAGDPRKADYVKGVTIAGTSVTVGLKFPVTLYSPGLGVDGGVYYDPAMSDADGEVPVRGVSFKVAVGKGNLMSPVQFPVAFIKLGRSLIGKTDDYVRSVLAHEFQHFSRLVGFRAAEKDQSAESKLLEAEAETTQTGDPMDNAETEAASLQLAGYLELVSDEDAKSMLLYLGRFMHLALSDFRDTAITRISAAVGKKPVQKLRLLKLIDGIKDNKRKKNLKPLRDALAR